MNADVIIPVCATNPGTFNMSMTAIRTCAATTAARLLVLGNNTENESYREGLRLTCDMIGARWEYIEGPFSMSRFWNMGTDMTNGEYIGYFGADTIFYQNWFENLVQCWNREPHYWVLVPFSLDYRNYPVERRTPKLEMRIVQTHNPAGAGQVFRRSSQWHWDEHFPLWEMDADLTYTLARSKGMLRGGCCYGSRVDHLYQGFTSQIDMSKHYGMDNSFGAATEALKKKWDLP